MLSLGIKVSTVIIVFSFALLERDLWPSTPPGVHFPEKTYNLYFFEINYLYSFLKIYTRLMYNRHSSVFETKKKNSMFSLFLINQKLQLLLWLSIVFFAQFVGKIKMHFQMILQESVQERLNNFYFHLRNKGGVGGINISSRWNNRFCWIEFEADLYSWSKKYFPIFFLIKRLLLKLTMKFIDLLTIEIITMISISHTVRKKRIK